MIMDSSDWEAGTDYVERWGLGSNMPDWVIHPTVWTYSVPGEHEDPVYLHNAYAHGIMAYCIFSGEDAMIDQVIVKRR
jgi:hypothetical protein